MKNLFDICGDVSVDSVRGVPVPLSPLPLVNTVFGQKSKIKNSKIPSPPVTPGCTKGRTHEVGRQGSSVFGVRGCAGVRGLRAWHPRQQCAQRQSRQLYERAEARQYENDTAVSVLNMSAPESEADVSLGHAKKAEAGRVTNKYNPDRHCAQVTGGLSSPFEIR